MKNKMTFLVLAFLLFSCSSTKKERVPEDIEHEEIEKDYVVIDSSSKFRPGWVEDPMSWAKAHGKEVDNFLFYSFETEPKVSRRISCDLAKANIKSDIAGEISTVIDKSLFNSIEGDADIDENNPAVRKLESYVENVLRENIKNTIHGARVQKTYWEKRSFKKDMGAQKDFKAYTCAVFVRMPKRVLDKAINLSMKKLEFELRKITENSSKVIEQTKSKVTNTINN